MIATKTLCIFFDFSTLHFAHLMSQLPAELSSGAPTTLKTIKQLLSSFKIFLLQHGLYKASGKHLLKARSSLKKEFLAMEVGNMLPHTIKNTTGSELMRKKRQTKIGNIWNFLGKGSSLQAR